MCRRCPRDERDLDNGLCTKTTSILDNMPVRCVGSWQYNKIYLLTRYFDIFTKGMKGRWKGLNYIEICSGPGRCIQRDTGEEIDGTAMSILRQPGYQFTTKAVFFDYDKAVIDTLGKRVCTLDAAKKATVMEGDYHNADGICDYLSSFPKDHLNLCFIDPTHCEVPFATIRRIIETLRSVDIIINVAIGTDIARNLPNAILSPDKFRAVRKKYENFLGLDTFFSASKVVAAAKTDRDEELRRLFIQAYMNQFEQLGYVYADQRPVEHYYVLLFLSKHKTGLSFWRKANSVGPDNQREMELH